MIGLSHGKVVGLKILRFFFPVLKKLIEWAFSLGRFLMVWKRSCSCLNLQIMKKSVGCDLIDLRCIITN